MAVCSFSSSFLMNNCTLVDNTFINEFLPHAPENAVKVYLYGLSLCSCPNSDSNSMESLCCALSMSEDEIMSIFSYWQEQGLVQVVNKTPFEIKFLSPKEFSGSAKLRSKGKYKEFNEQIQSILSGRMISPFEYNNYYDLIERLHYEPEAIVMLIKHCTNLKGASISYPYIRTIINSFEDDGKTVVALEQKLMEQEKASSQITAILKALGLKRDADLDERNMYLKWTNIGFTDAVILELAKSLNKRGGMNKLDELVMKCYEQKLFTMSDIENYSKEKELMFTIAKKITSTLGLYYQNLESVVEVYVKEWLNKGYDQETLCLLASYCFKQDIKSLSLMNEIVLKFYKLGIVSKESLQNYFANVVSQDMAIKEILDKLQIVRRVNSADRDYFKTWTEDWHFSKDIIDLVLEKSKGTSWPLRYMNHLLLELNSKNIKDVESAKKYLDGHKTSAAAPSADFSQREYTKEQLSALFDSLDDIEV